MLDANTDHTEDGNLLTELGSSTLDAGLNAGQAIAGTLAGLTQPKLTLAQRDRLHRLLAGLAARGAYAGLALWALNALTADDDSVASLSEALTGLSIGVLGAQPAREPAVRR